MASSRARRRVFGVAVVAVAAALLVGAGAGGAGAKPKADEAWTPNDPLFERQWALQQIRTPQAWQRSRGEGVVIAVVDSGVDLEHEDLRERLVQGATFAGCAETGDGCGGGDWTVNLHGTAVAGIAAATGNNAQGIVGVAPAASLMPIQVATGAPPEPYLAAAIARGIEWATENGADVINVSLGLYTEGTPLSPAGEVLISDAVQYARSHGVVVVQAYTGPYLCPGVSHSARPLGDPGVLCAVGTDRREQPVPYSGPLKSDLLTVSAPAGIPLVCDEGLTATVPKGTRTGDCAGTDGYDGVAGSSFAAPHIAGVAALLLALGCDDEAAVALITSTARHPLTGARGEWGPVYGYGIVDADAATAAAATECNATKEKTKDIS